MAYISDSENYRRITNASAGLIDAIQHGAKCEGRTVRNWKIEDDFNAFGLPTLHLYLEPLPAEYLSCAMPKEGVPVPPVHTETPQARELREAARLLVLVAECFKNIASMLDKS